MKIMGCSLKLSTAHHPQTDGLAERMIQTLEDMIRRYCAFGMMFEDHEGYTHDWVSLLPGLEFAYNSTTTPLQRKLLLSLREDMSQIPQDFY